jgi:UDP-N-acetylglucosamine acyltransferase
MAVLVADTAWVDPGARLEDGVEIGPFCIVGPSVVIGRCTRLAGHVCIQRGVIIGARNTFEPFCVIGAESSPRPDQSPVEPALEIHDGNRFQEGVIVSRGISAASGPTRIGGHNQLAAHAQVGPSCRLADHTVVSSGVLLGRAVEVLSHATLSPAVVVHHDVTIGEQSFVGPQSRIYHDVPPFMLVDGHPARVRCINIVSLKRQGLAAAEIEALHEAHRLVFRAKMSLAKACETLSGHGHSSPAVDRLFSFLRVQDEGRHGRARDHQTQDARHNGVREVPA